MHDRVHYKTLRRDGGAEEGHLSTLGKKKSGRHSGKIHDLGTGPRETQAKQEQSPVTASRLRQTETVRKEKPALASIIAPMGTLRRDHNYGLIIKQRNSTLDKQSTT